MSSTMRNIGNYITVQPGTIQTITAGGTGDATEVNGVTIDRNALTQGRGQSAVLAILVKATMASAATTAIVTANFQDSANDSDWTDYGTALGATTTHSAAGGALTASSAVAKLSVNLASARRYIRAQVMCDLSASGTDTALISSVIIIAGQAQLPAN